MGQHEFTRDEDRPDERKHKFQTQFGVREMTDAEASDLQSQGLMVNRVADDAEVVDSLEEAKDTANAVVNAPQKVGENDPRTDEERAAEAREAEQAKVDAVSTPVVGTGSGDNEGLRSTSGGVQVTDEGMVPVETPAEDTATKTRKR